MENLRKRLEREKSEYLQFALSELLLELLGVLDNFERALEPRTTDADGKTFREGVELIYRMYQNLLFKKGVRPIEIKDRAFDPNLHHAMATEESDERQGAGGRRGAPEGLHAPRPAAAAGAGQGPRAEEED